ncbi:MucR family transcriptional regulator [Novosphingobium sp. KCTC 2891]|uniref:MucR family transcriptional regulator n=1 Tax=unclassified Novosphingobium TaxID=2644732 RepID=UPI001CEFBF64|nr:MULTISPECIES: MucR family transcriptional regulator [unclassified Novosphingobium]MCW1384500.1 MucR family transcriptional regulator [Novosphingobium sp. KCTC 2891]
MAETQTLLDHVADIVTAHVSNNAVSAHDLPGLIIAVHASLARLGQATEIVDEERKPAVSVRASVKPDAIACLECGAKLKLLKRHLGSDHGLTPAEYRVRWSLPASYPMVAPDYAARRKELALSIGLGRKPLGAPAQVAEPVQDARSKLAPARKAPVKRKAASGAPADEAAVKRKAPRKKLKVAFDAVDVPQADALVAGAEPQG